MAILDRNVLQVIAPGPGLLRLSVDNLTWLGTSGIAGLEVTYFSLLDVALGKRPYYSGRPSTAGCEFTRQCGDDVAHLLVRTNCLALGETVGHDLCQQQPKVNATLAGTELAWQWSMIAGDRALPFNISQLPASVHNDLHVSISYGPYTAKRVLRFARTPRPPQGDTTVPVQVDHFTKTLSIGGEPFVASGHYFGDFSGDDFLNLIARLPKMVAAGINLGVMLTLPAANHSVQSAFFKASADAGFKVVYPAFIFDSVGVNLTKDVRRLASEPALLGWYICGVLVTHFDLIFGRFPYAITVHQMTAANHTPSSQPWQEATQRSKQSIHTIRREPMPLTLGPLAFPE
eukprot:SAG31_NODE_175_length_21352_cov_3.981508_18_plen_345_part_00